MFRILYLFLLQEPPSWVAYLHTGVILGLCGLVYYQCGKRRIGFMVMFIVMAGIFMVDLLAYLPFLVYLLLRDRRRGRMAQAKIV